MATLQIRKKSTKVWQHVPSDGSTFILSKLYAKTDAGVFKVVEDSGSNRKEYDYTNISVFDDTDAGAEETFASAELLMLRLEELSYVGFNRDGEVPTFDPSDYDLDDFNNADGDPFARQSEITGVDAAAIATINHAATEKTTLVDADEFPAQNSADAFSLIRVTFLNLWNNYIKPKVDFLLGVKIENSTGSIDGFGITDNGNGTVDIASGTAYIRSAVDPFSPLVKYTLPAVTNLALTDNTTNFVLVDYNGGTPALTVTTNPGTINVMTNAITYVISRIGTELDYISLIGQTVDFNGKLRRRFLNSEGLFRAQGAVLTGINRNIAVTTGLYYSGLIDIHTPTFNTSTVDTFTQAYENGATWIKTTGNTQINNTQYNNAGTLTTLPNNDFRVDYIYILANNPSKLYVLLGNANYSNITNARLAPTPSNLPSELQYIGTRIGRAIIQKNASTMEVSSEFTEVYKVGTATLHNDLGGLNFGDFLHLTSAQVAALHPQETAASIAAIATLQKTISGNTTLDDTYNGCIVKVKSTANITVPSTLMTNFSCIFDCWTGATATFIEGAGANIIETTLTLAPEKMATLYKDGATTDYKLKGELS